ncbi:MAG TPA: hybrid sensor histidine kinase/response regulator [Casimicrobiaceae bacterium]|nr:hybrid sensor histidine kinase/response regulator [Casimicrobiaceae bacterium]
MSGDLLRVLAHELRNSIAPIVNAVQLVRLRAGSDRELAAALAIVDRQIAAMTRMLDAVGDAERLARGDVALELQRIDLAASVESARQAHAGLIENRRQRVRLQSPARPVWVDGDPALLARAIGNLIENAAKYSDAGSEIAIEVLAADNEAQVRVRDSGQGLAPDLLPQLFDACAARPPGRAGLGLGLATARAICERHHGRIGVRSEGPGRGSEFTIGLPLASPPQDRAAAPTAGPAKTMLACVPPASAAQGSRRILVADDNQAVRNSFAAILQEMGHDVRLAADGIQAVELAEAWSPEFVIVDVHMPKIDGYAVARKLRARFPPAVMRLVMMSGTDLDPTTLIGAKQAGFDHCVDKTLAVKGLDALLRDDPPPLQA